jgi:hypothetical protein
MNRAFAAYLIKRHEDGDRRIVGAVYDGVARELMLRHYHDCDALAAEDAEFLAAVGDWIKGNGIQENLNFRKARQEVVPASSASWRAETEQAPS